MNIWIIVAVIIIVALLGYWLHLLRQIRTKRSQALAEREAAVRKRQLNIAESVEVIAKATAAGQCDLSEASIRITQLLMAYPQAQMNDWPQIYPGLFGLYKLIGHLPTHQQRLDLPKQERFQQDKYRLSQEDLFADLIQQEVEQLSDFYSQGAPK